MKLSLFLAASAVTASVLQPRDAINPPNSAFQRFEVVSLEEAKVGKDRDIQGLPPKPISNLTSTGAKSKAGSKFGVSLLASTGAKVTTAASRACAASPNYRFEWRQYSTTRRLGLVNGIKCLMNKAPSGRFSASKNRYEDLVQLHQSMMPAVHNNALFLIWHRYFLWTFEQVLRAECGFNRAFVWWDETKDAGAFAKSDIFSSAYFGTLNPPTSAGNPMCVVNGAFNGVLSHIGPGQSETTHCISRAVTETNTAQCNANFVNYCLQRASYPDFETCFEYGPHGYGHNGIGGVMQDVWSSVGDPVFWLHHAFVDRVYWAWQQANPARLTTISGVDGSGKPLTLDYVISMGGIRPDVRIRDILDPMGGVLIGGQPFCYTYSY